MLVVNIRKVQMVNKDKLQQLLLIADLMGDFPSQIKIARIIQLTKIFKLLKLN